MKNQHVRIDFIVKQVASLGDYEEGSKEESIYMEGFLNGIAHQIWKDAANCFRGGLYAWEIKDCDFETTPTESETLKQLSK